MDRQSLKFRLLAFTSIVILIMSLLNIYSIVGAISLETQYRDMIDKQLSINEIDDDMNLSVFYFDKYFLTRSQSDLSSYRQYYQTARNQVSQFDGSLNPNDDYIVSDIKNVMATYYDSAEQTILMFSPLTTTGKPYLYTNTKNYASYISKYVKDLQAAYVDYNKQIYKNLLEKNKASRYITVFLIAAVTFGCVLFTIVFSHRITVPIAKLVENYRKVSQGEFSVPSIETSGMTEIDILGTGFNKMVSNINSLVEEIKKKADVEKKLKDQEMENLLYQNMLKEASLKMLQSQINPHFLFNTLNAIVQTSMMEEAVETEKLINSVSELLRYSLSMIDKQSTVGNEIEIVKRYIYIQETRFKDRVKFFVNVDEKLKHIKIPGMILQPLVENAFIHGIEGIEDGGEIYIDVYRQNEYCIIKIEDTGAGMTNERISQILNMKSEEKHIGHTTGIGMQNVIKRLRIFYGFEDVLSIESNLNAGTKIFIKIPIYEAV